MVEFGGCSGRPQALGSAEKNHSEDQQRVQNKSKNNPLTVLADEIQWCLAVGVTPQPTLGSVVS